MKKITLADLAVKHPFSCQPNGYSNECNETHQSWADFKKEYPKWVHWGHSLYEVNKKNGSSLAPLPFCFLVLDNNLKK